MRIRRLSPFLLRSRSPFSSFPPSCIGQPGPQVWVLAHFAPSPFFFYRQLILLAVPSGVFCVACRSPEIRPSWVLFPPSQGGERPFKLDLCSVLQQVVSLVSDILFLSPPQPRWPLGPTLLVCSRPFLIEACNRANCVPSASSCMFLLPVPGYGSHFPS